MKSYLIRLGCTADVYRTEYLHLPDDSDRLPHLIYCIEAAPLLSNFQADVGLILMFFPIVHAEFDLQLDSKVAHLDFRCRWITGSATAFCWLFATFLSGAVSAQTFSGEAAAAPLLHQMELAGNKLKSATQRVLAQGQLRGWTQLLGQTQPQVYLDAEVLILTDGPKFHLQILHAPDPSQTPPQPERLEIAVFDGSNIYTFLSVGNRQRGGVFYEFSQSAVLRSAGYPFATLIHFGEDALTLKELDVRSMSIADVGEGGVLLKEDRASYIRQIYLGSRDGLDLQRVALRHPGAAIAFREHWLNWSQKDQLRYVQHYGVRHRYALKEAPEGQLIARQYEITLQQFMVNVSHDPRLFTLEGLGIPQGTEFLDYRRNVKGRRVVLRWSGTQLEEVVSEDTSAEMDP